MLRPRTTVALLVAAACLAGAAPAAADPASCRAVRLPVALAGGLPATETAAAELCRPAGDAPRARVVQLLVHGGTYARSYWSWPQEPERYSYVRSALRAGFSTLAVDRLGAGQTTRPPSAAVTFPTNAHVLHQWIGALRAGRLDGRPAERVVSVGHSFGSAYAVEEAALYGDVDAVLLSGFLHASGPGAGEVTQALHPAALDPRFAGRVGDPGWLTTRPGQRGVFYWLPGADPAVVAHDESLKDLLSTAEFPGLFAQVFGPPAGNRSQAIDVPVLLANGVHDSLFCGLQVSCTDEQEIVALEAPYFPRAPSLDVALLADQGHDLNLHRAAPRFFALAQDWVARVAAR